MKASLTRFMAWCFVALMLAATITPAYAAAPTVGTYIQQSDGSTRNGIGVTLMPATSDGTPTIGEVGTAVFSPPCTTLTLPGTGGTYTSGDFVSNNATAASTTPLTCVIAARAVGPVTITRAKISTTNATVTNGQFRIHVYLDSPTMSFGNDGVFLSTRSAHFCKIDVTLDQVFSDGADGFGTPSTGSCSRVLLTGQTVYVEVEARAAYVWAAAQPIVIYLEGFN